MARERDDDSRDRRDDSPGRRQDDEGPEKGGTGKVLLIIVICVGIPLLTCGGVIAYIAYVASQVVASFKQGVDHVVTTAQTEVAAANFLTTLQSGNVDGAYDGTTANFKATTSKEGFAKLVKDNPVLTSTHHADPNGLAVVTGTSPNRKATARFVVNLSDVADEMKQVDSRTTTGTSRKPPSTKPASTAPGAEGVSCTVIVAEQADGTWKVDGFTVH